MGAQSNQSLYLRPTGYPTYRAKVTFQNLIFLTPQRVSAFKLQEPSSCGYTEGPWAFFFNFFFVLQAQFSDTTT